MKTATSDLHEVAAQSTIAEHDATLTDAELDNVSGGFIVGAVTRVGSFVKDIAVGAFQGGIDGTRAGFSGTTKR